MKQTLFLATLLGATLGFSSISRADEYDRVLHGNETLDLGGEVANIKVDVISTGNTMTNGTLIGTLTLEENSTLVSDSAMASCDGPTAIVMNNGSTLEMATGSGKDRWINDVSKLLVNGTATVVNAYLRIKPGETYTLGNGVQNLVGLERSFLSLDNSTLDLGNGEISKLAIGVWSAFAPYNNVIKNGTLNTYVEIDPEAKLTLQNVTIGDDASFAMRDKTQLDLGGASVKLGKVTLENDATATVDNGTLWVGTGETVTLNPNLGGNYVIDLRGDATLDLGEQWHNFGLTVSGQDITLTNGRFIGTLTLESDSYLKSEAALATSTARASIVMKDGSTLEMAGSDLWIQDISKLSVEEGTATIKNGYLRVLPNTEYTLGNGVENLVGEGATNISLDNSTLILGDKTTNLNIIVWSAFGPSSTIRGDKGSKIDTSVSIITNSKLSLQGVTIGDNASFTMKDNTQLDLGQAKEEYMVTVQTPLKTESWLATRDGIGLNKFTFTGQSARIDNGTLWVGDHISGDNETVTLGTDLSGTAAMKLDYDQATLKFGGHKWTMTQSNGTELFTMEDNGGYTGAITGRAEIDVDSGTQDKNHVQFKGKGADRPDWVQVQGVKLTTKSDFHMENAVISGSLIDIGEGTTMYLVNVEIKADTRFTDDTAMLDMRNTTAWLEQDVNTYVTGSETVETDTTLQMSGNKGQSITMAAGSKGINLTCDMFDSVTLDGTDLWLDMTDIAERGTLLGWDYFTLTFDSMTQEVEQALTYISTLQIFAKLGEDYITNAYVSYSDYAEHDDRASRLFFKLVPTPEPTTGTLGLLALAALAARRRK